MEAHFIPRTNWPKLSPVWRGCHVQIRGTGAVLKVFNQRSTKQAGRYFLSFGEITNEISKLFMEMAFAESYPPYQ